MDDGDLSELCEVLFVKIGKQRSWDKEANMQVEVRIYVSHHGDVLWLDKRTGDVYGFDELWVQGIAVSVRDRILTTSRFTQVRERARTLPEIGATTVVGTPFVTKFSRCEF